jgi:hypothetical protein
MPLRYKIKPGYVEDRKPTGSKDMQGQEVTVRIGDAELQGHIISIRSDIISSIDTKGREQTRPPGDNAEGHKFKRIEVKLDNAQVSLLRAAADTGKPVYVRFSDEDDVQGHLYRAKF